MQKRQIFPQPTNLSVPLQKYSMCFYSYLGKCANMVKLSTLMLQFKVSTNKKQKDSIKYLFMQKEETDFHGEETEHFQSLTLLSKWTHNNIGKVCIIFTWSAEGSVKDTAEVSSGRLISELPVFWLSSASCFRIISSVTYTNAHSRRASKNSRKTI